MYTWSTEQLRAIEADTDIIVSASAGSGKTTLMIERILRLVRRGVPVERMLVVTFASAQADDMRAKLERGFEEALAGEALDQSEREAVRRAKYRLAGASVSTLHAFCADLLRAYFYLADIEADFAVSPAPDTELRKSAACEAAIREMQKRGDPEFDLLYDALSVNRGHEVLKRAVFRIHELAATMPDPEEVWKRTRENASAAAAELGRERNFEERNFRSRGSALILEASQAGAVELADFLGNLMPYIGTYGEGISLPILKMPKFYAESPVYEALTAQAREWKSELSKSIKDLSDRVFAVPQPLIPPLETLVRLYDARYRALKDADGVLDFNDLERNALAVLASPVVLDAVRQKYEYVFVDEYQDINSLQREILAAVDGANVFMVGDVKQSIYAFRLCDPDIFRARYRELSAEGKAVDLNCNYRTAAPILEFCNYLFSAMMTEEFGGADYAHKAMFRPALPAALSPAVELHLFTKPAQEQETFGGVYSVREDVADPERGATYAEGRLIAEKIRALVGREVGGKTLRYADMAILLRDMKNIDGLLSALTDCGIPVATRRDYRLFESAGVCALANLLRVLSNPAQDWPLLSVMCSPLFEFTETELAEIRLDSRGTAAEKLDFFRACEAARETRAHVKHMYERLDAWRAWAGYLAPAEVLRRAVAETGFYGGLLKRANGDAEVKLAKLFLETVAASRCGNDLITYLAYLDSAADFSVEITDGGADAVTVTTMHKSKGLEYGVVFLARLGKTFSGRDVREELYVDKEFGVVMKSYDALTRSKETNSLRDIAANAMTYRTRQEELRLLYVACTRAKYKLFLIASGDFARTVPACSAAALVKLNAPAQWILSVLQRDASKVFPFEAKASEITALDYTVETHERETGESSCPPPIVPRADEALVDLVARGLAYRYPYRTDLPAKTTATDLNEAAGILAVRDPNAARLSDGADAAAVGNAYHRAMQSIDFGADVESELDRLLRENLITDEECGMIDAGRIQSAVAAVAKMRPKSLRRELPFLAKFPARQFYGEEGTLDSEVLVQGVVDLLIETDEGYVLVDYKTGAGDEGYLRAKYATQLRIYASACARAGYPVVRAMIWSFANNCAAEIELGTDPREN